MRLARVFRDDGKMASISICIYNTASYVSILLYVSRVMASFPRLVLYTHPPRSRICIYNMASCSVFMINSKKCQRRRMHYLEPVGAGPGIQHHNNHAAHDHGSKHDLPGHLQHGIAELSPQPSRIVLIWKNNLFTEISPFREPLATPAGNTCTHRNPQGAGGSSRRRHLPC